MVDDQCVGARSAFGEVLGHAARVADSCTACGVCVKRCAFLSSYGTPKNIAEKTLQGEHGADPYLCSLCGLCGAVCPEKVAPVELFHAQRRLAVADGTVNWAPYRALLAYQSLGKSRLLSLLRLPEGCTTLFFPGCNLPGTRPRTMWRLWRRLRALSPQLGIALGCCAKPDHDLGRQASFEEHFKSVRSELLGRGVQTVLVACPNCHKVFTNYGKGLEVQTVWEWLAKKRPALQETQATVFVHDPCPLRHAPGTQDAVRTLLKSTGLTIRELRNRRGHTLCCGEGGAILNRDPKLAQSWTKRLTTQADGKPIVTSCGGCVGFLQRSGARSIHIADILDDPQRALQGRTRSSGAPWTYVNRLLLKLRLRFFVRTRPRASRSDHR